MIYFVLQSFKSYLSQYFDIIELGSLSYFLGLEVFSGDDGYFLIQASYGLSPSGTHVYFFNSLMNHAQFTLLNKRILFDPTFYRHLVVNLMYLIVTRPNLLCFVFFFFLVSDSCQLLVTLLSLSLYGFCGIEENTNFRVFISRSIHIYFELCAYSIPPWGFDFFIVDALISLESKKQPSYSSRESEYRAFVNTITKLLRRCWLSENTDISHSFSSPIFSNNKNTNPYG